MDATPGGQRRTLWDFITPRVQTPGVQGISSSIVRPAVEVNNFELRLTLVYMVQQA